MTDQARFRLQVSDPEQVYYAGGADRAEGLPRVQIETPNGNYTMRLDSDGTLIVRWHGHRIDLDRMAVLPHGSNAVEIRGHS